MGRGSWESYLYVCVNVASFGEEGLWGGHISFLDKKHSLHEEAGDIGSFFRLASLTDDKLQHVARNLEQVTVTISTDNVPWGPDVDADNRKRRRDGPGENKPSPVATKRALGNTACTQLHPSNDAPPHAGPEKPATKNKQSLCLNHVCPCARAVVCLKKNLAEVRRNNNDGQKLTQAANGVKEQDPTMTVVHTFFAEVLTVAWVYVFDVRIRPMERCIPKSRDKEFCVGIVVVGPGSFLSAGYGPNNEALCDQLVAQRIVGEEVAQARVQQGGGKSTSS